jgi:hypothetical protein
MNESLVYFSTRSGFRKVIVSSYGYIVTYLNAYAVYTTQVKMARLHPVVLYTMADHS